MEDLVWPQNPSFNNYEILKASTPFGGIICK